MPLIKFPNVPDFPGVPAIPRITTTTKDILRISTSILQGIIWRHFQVKERWGIWDKDGVPLGDPSKITDIVGEIFQGIGIGSTLSTSSVDYSKETRVSDFPVEGGGFASFNKVESPASPIVTICMQGGDGDRRKFLEDIDSACKSTGIYSVVMPEKEYIGYTIDRYSYQRRSSGGVTLLIVEVSLKEVRAVSAIYTKSIKVASGNTKSVSSAKNVDSGKVQAKTPKQSVLKSIYVKINDIISGG